MSEWYYISNGQSTGPVSFETLQTLAASGHFNDPANLVWTQGMDEWTTANNIPGLIPAARPPAPPAGGQSGAPANPYAAPTVATYQAPAPSPTHPDIEPGTEPFEPTMVVSAGWRAFKNNIWPIIVFGIFYFVVYIAISVVVSMIFPSTTGTPVDLPEFAGSSEFVEALANQEQAHPVAQIISFLLDSLFSLYVCRFLLSIISGQQVDAGLILGESKKFGKIVLSNIVFALILVVSLIPGIGLLAGGFFMSSQESPLSVPMIIAGSVLTLIAYFLVACRLSFFTYSIVDRGTGPIDALKDSWALTRNNIWRIILLGLIFIGLGILGLIPFGLGLLIVIPMAMLSTAVAYRWMRVGHRAATDVM